MSLPRRPAGHETLKPFVRLHLLGGIHQILQPRGVGTHQRVPSGRFLSRALLKPFRQRILLMFEPGYLKRLMETGEADGEARADDISALLEPSAEA